MAVRNSGGPITMPVGKETLGRILNVIGEPVDELGPIKATRRMPIFTGSRRPSPRWTCTRSRAFETGIKVVDLLAPYTRGGRDRPVRRRRRGQDRMLLQELAHPQRRHRARRLLGVRRRRRAHP